MEERILSAQLREKVVPVEKAISSIQSGMTLGFSGFTGAGYPKVIPTAIANSGVKDLTIIAGASTGDELDGEMARNHAVGKRYPFQSNKDLKKLINSGEVKYRDYHLGQVSHAVRNGTYGKIDYAIIECCQVQADGGIVPTISVGVSNALVERAEHVILELNTTFPLEMVGIHDIGITSGKKIEDPLDRVGTIAIPCDPNKIEAILVTDFQGKNPVFSDPDEISSKIAQNIISFIDQEIKAQRLPEKFTFQSGVGKVANAVLDGLAEGGYKGIKMYTEVLQDGALRLVDGGCIAKASATALSFSDECLELFIKKLPYFKERIVLRPQDISNGATQIQQMGLIAMNTAVEADIYGNVNSTHICGTKMINGIGGSNDFSRNGEIAVFMTPSTAKGGLISSIVPMASHVDNSEHDVDIIVTECGFADLRGKSPKERAVEIIANCAHPDYREALTAYFEQAKALTGNAHTPHDLTKALSWHQRFIETGSMKAN